MKEKNFLVSLNNIETRGVDILQEQKMLKAALMVDEDIKQKVMDYIFGKSDENPLQNITEKYEMNREILDNRIEQLAKYEKRALKGKKKRDVNFVKKLENIK